MSHQIVTVHEEDDGIRLDRWFKRHYPDIPHGLVQKLLRKGAIKVGGKKAETSTRISAGQEIRVPHVNERPQEEVYVPKPKYEATFEDAQRLLIDNILYEDQHMIAFNKPAGLAAQGGSKIKLSVDSLLYFLAQGGSKPKLVHRIDKDTSGVMIVAKSAKAATELGKRFKEKTLEKTYWAIVVGEPEIPSGKISMPVLAKKSDGKNEKSVVDESEGKPAITLYRIIEKAARRLSWMELQPVTGRMHQLRVHMSAIGHPIVGDGKYGGTDAFIEGISEKMHLHARRIVIPNFYGKKIDVKAPLPPHMEETFEMMGFEPQHH
ncbi:MAG: RluA family pseudouridine synthase [Proteobacteria bacterium]|nr:RluA family pseudouridine synthase [Pseudomonadota bacterium]